MHFRQGFVSSDALWKHNFDPVLKLTGWIAALNKFNQIAVAFSLRAPARENFPIAAAKFFTHSHKIIYNIQTYSYAF